MLFFFVFFFSTLLDQIVPIRVQLERSLRSMMSMFYMIVKTDDVTSGAKEKDPQGRLRAVQVCEPKLSFQQVSRLQVFPLRPHSYY